MTSGTVRSQYFSSFVFFEVAGQVAGQVRDEPAEGGPKHPRAPDRGIGCAAGTGRGVFRDTGEAGGGFGHTGFKRDVTGRNQTDLKSTRNFLSNDPSHAWGYLQRSPCLISAEMFALVTVL